MHLWFLNALSGSWHGISSTPNQNRIQLEIKINTWLMSKSIPKPTPILQPSLIQYQNQGSKSIPRIQYRYLSRNQPVSPIPGLGGPLPEQPLLSPHFMTRGVSPCRSHSPASDRGTKAITDLLIFTMSRDIILIFFFGRLIFVGEKLLFYWRKRRTKAITDLLIFTIILFSANWFLFLNY